MTNWSRVYGTEQGWDSGFKNKRVDGRRDSQFGQWGEPGGPLWALLWWAKQTKQIVSAGGGMLQPILECRFGLSEVSY